MDLGLKSRMALVTGGSRGIGYAIAESLAGEGCNLQIVARTKSAVEEAAQRLATKHGVKVTPHAYDLSDPAEAEKAVKACGDVDILVNNAGAIPKGHFETVPDAKLQHATGNLLQLVATHLDEEMERAA